jgi:hypothetical protein
MEKSEATIKQHMNQQKKNVRSTHPKMKPTEDETKNARAGS